MPMGNTRADSSPASSPAQQMEVDRRKFHDFKQLLSINKQQWEKNYRKFFEVTYVFVEKLI